MKFGDRCIIYTGNLRTRDALTIETSYFENVNIVKKVFFFIRINQVLRFYAHLFLRFNVFYSNKNMFLKRFRPVPENTYFENYYYFFFLHDINRIKYTSVKESREFFESII